MDSWKARCRLLGSSEFLHPAKILLGHLASDGNGVSLYRSYLSETLNLNISCSTLGSMSDQVIGRFYRLDEPLAPPKYFDLKAAGCQDVSKLESCLGVRIVIVSPSKRKGQFFVVHDRSVYGLVGAREEDEKPERIICLERKAKATLLYACPDRMGYDPLEYLTGRGYVSAARVAGASDEGCIAESLAELLSTAAVQHRHDDFCRRLPLILSDWRKLRDLVAEPPFVVVTHLRTALFDNSRRAKEYFGMLNTPPSPPEESRAVCLLRDGTFFLVRKDKVPALLTPEVRGRYPPSEDMPSPMAGIRAGACMPPDPKESERQRTPGGCDCGGCEGAASFSPNMAEGGPPLLYRHDTTLFDLLRSVGLLDEASEALVNRCAALSLACLDVETFSIKVREEAGNEDCLFPYTPVAPKGLPRAIRARMEPVLIGYSDTLLVEGGGEEDVKIFGGWSAEDERTERADLVAKFAAYVRGRQLEATAAKLRLLSPLLDWAEKYSRAFAGHLSRTACSEPPEDRMAEVLDDEFIRHVMSMKDEDLHDDTTLAEADEAGLREKLLGLRGQRLKDLGERAFEHTVFGKIRAAVKRLLSLFIVYAFNGQRFDFVILAGDICCHFKNLGQTVRLRRDGMAVKSISVSGNLQFQEAGLLLSPGTSLDSLGKLIGLEIRKFRFPFELLSSYQFLRQTHLPPDKEAWASGLTSSKKDATQEEVDYFLDLYAREGHACVGEFLVRYLRLDCLILQRSMLKVVEGYYDLLGVNLVESFKMTISSLSSFGVQVEMFRRKRVGFFFCNNAKIYSCLKQGTRGGYVAVHNTCAGSKADTAEYARLLTEQLEAAGSAEARSRVAPNLEAYPSSEAYLRACNPHLGSPGEVREPANFIQYLDVNSLYGTAARSALPFGSAVFYSLEERFGDQIRRRPPREVRGEDFGRRCSDPTAVLRRGQLATSEKRGGAVVRRSAPVDLMGGEESAFVQYMALAVFPEADLVFSSFHSSCGQLTFGASPQCKADVTLVVKAGRAESGEEVVNLVVSNFHGRFFHNAGHHYENCPLFPQADTLPSQAGRDHELRRARTEADDLLKAGLAEALSAVDPRLRIVYVPVTSCDLFCRGGDFLRPRSIRWAALDETPATGDDCFAGHKGLRQMLEARFPEDSVLGFPVPSMTTGELMNRIMYSGTCHDGSTAMGGFVVITRGEECVAKDREKAFGFCFQRSRVRREELGPWTLRSAETVASKRTGLPMGHPRVLAARDRILDDLLKEPLTLSRRSFGRSTECLSLDYFRWLVAERGLRGIEVRHYIHMTEKTWLGRFFTGLLQARHDLKRVPDSGLRRDQLKLIVNGFYGYNAMQANAYPKTSIVAEGTLRRMTEQERLRRLLPSRGVAVTLMGCTAPKKGAPELVYAISRWNREGPIRNTIQVAATILSMSKVIFFSHLLSILRNFDPAKVALLYSDTDSLVLGTTHLELERCFDPGRPAADYDAVRDRLLEDPASAREQSGKLKIEAVYESGYFRGSKAYFLGHSVEDGESLARMRSVPRALHPLLTEEQFQQDARKNDAVVTYFSMAPTRGLQIVKARQSRSLSVALNTKLFSLNPVHTTMLP